MAPAQIANLPEGRVLVFRRGINPVLGRARMAWHRTDVHDIHHPDALTVRARAWRRRQHAHAAGWLDSRTRPARAWTTARRASAAGWCGARLTALRVRVTGHGGPTGYLSPHVVPGEVVDPSTDAHDGGSGGAAVIPFPSGWARPEHHDHNDPDLQNDDELGRPWGDPR